MAPTVAVVVPALNESPQLEQTLCKLAQQDLTQIVVVDGGSNDGSLSIVQQVAATEPRVTSLHSDRGRARQMNAGAAVVSADVVCFVHADTELPADAVDQIRAAIRTGARWGRFDVRFDSDDPIFSIVAWAMNQRSALTGICTGDQALWVQRKLFETVGCFAALPLMEDIEFSTRLKRIGGPFRIRSAVTTSARRWVEHGIIRTIFLMWWLRLLFWLGVPADRLAQKYG